MQRWGWRGKGVGGVCDRGGGAGDDVGGCGDEGVVFYAPEVPGINATGHDGDCAREAVSGAQSTRPVAPPKRMCRGFSGS